MIPTAVNELLGKRMSVFYSPSQERVRLLQKGASRIFPGRKEVFAWPKKKGSEKKKAHDRPHRAEDEQEKQDTRTL